MTNYNLFFEYLLPLLVWNGVTTDRLNNLLFAFSFPSPVNILGDQKFFIKTSRGIISRSLLKRYSDVLDMLPTDTGNN